jgi:hypothetical protein
MVFPEKPLSIDDFESAPPPPTNLRGWLSAFGIELPWLQEQEPRSETEPSETITLEN